MSTALRYGLLLLVGVASTGCAGPEEKVNLLADPGGSGKTVYLVSHGWHAGVVIRRGDIPDGVWPEHRDFANAQYLEVGWGDSDYYRTPNPHWGITLKAGLLPTASVLHVVGFSGNVAVYFPYSEIIAIRLTDQGLERLCRYIAASYSKDAAGETVSLGRGLYGRSRFYQSSETYHLFNNCNAWIGRALQIAGCPVNPVAMLTVENLMEGARTCGKVIQSQRGASVERGNGSSQQ